MAQHRRRSLAFRPVHQATMIVMAVLLAGAALLTVGGFSTVAFTSGSMQPTIGDGALGITREVPADDIEVGDIVSVPGPDDGLVTHRVVDVEELSWITSLTLRGDANRADDPMPYLVDHADRVVFSIPAVGRWVDAELQVAAAVALVGLGLGAMAWRSRRTRSAHRSLGAPAAARTGAAGLVTAAVAAVTVLGAAPTSAYWTDAGAGSSGTFATTPTIPTPSFVSCAVHDFHVDGTWTNSGQRYNYRATLNQLDGVQVGNYSSPPYAGAVDGTTNLTRDIYVSDFGISPEAIAATGQFNFNVRVYAQAFGSTATASRWLSNSYATIPVRFEFISGSNYQMRCGHDEDTNVTITSLGPGLDSGVSNTDFITNVANNAIVGTGEPGSSISVRRGGVQIGTATVGSDGNWSANVTLTEGQFEIQAIATDIFGHTATDSQDVVLDTTAPTATQSAATCTASGNPVTGVSGATWCKMTARNWTATFSDNAGGSGLVPTTGRQYRNNGGPWTNYTTAVSMAQFKGRVMEARGTDVAGNVGTASGTYYLDGTAPTLTVRQPTPGVGLSLALLGPLLNSQCAGNLACGTSSDTISGLPSVTSVKWKLTRDAIVDTCYTATGTTSCTGYAFQNAGGTLPNWVVPRSYVGFYSVLSAYIFQAQATDDAGNVATVTVTFSTVL